MITGHLPELMIVLVLAFVVFGPKRIPELGGALGRGIRDFKHGVHGLETDMAVQTVPAENETVTETPHVETHVA